MVHRPARHQAASPGNSPSSPSEQPELPGRTDRDRSQQPDLPYPRRVRIIHARLRSGRRPTAGATAAEGADSLNAYALRIVTNQRPCPPAIPGHPAQPITKLAQRAFKDDGPSGLRNGKEAPASAVTTGLAGIAQEAVALLADRGDQFRACEALSRPWRKVRVLMAAACRVPDGPHRGKCRIARGRPGAWLPSPAHDQRVVPGGQFDQAAAGPG
jgi:hypothetical protein